ncbi:MAG: alpha-amylase family protein [Chthoniobacteraceae bacterium]
MKLKPLRFRQIHLDFHTSPHIDGIGSRFNKKQWIETLKRGAVDSVTTFAKCHHGWSYHPTKVGKMHPHLNFDLLRAQYDACKEADIKCPVYVSAGVDNLATGEHPEWREIDGNGAYMGWSKRILDPGFHTIDFHSPYLDYLCAQIREVVELFPEADGIFLDIINQQQSCGKWSMEYMLANGLDPEKEEDRRKSARHALETYYIATTAACKSVDADMPVMHNAGHIPRGGYDVFKYFSHLELESLPTGGWGYDHFPMSAKYTCNLPFDFLGMTGKFHTTWGEFGGFKHPNALRYECAAMLAYGARCSVGDQLHPDGALDESTYDVIGAAYREVEAKEPWCVDAKQVFDLGVLSSESENHIFRECIADEGATRVLLESHFLFGILDRTMDFSAYKAILLPDDIRIDAELKAKLDAYMNGGGKLILSGESGLWKGREEFAFDIGAEYSGLSEFSPDYILPVPELRPDFVQSPEVMYLRSHRIRVTSGKSLGDVLDPYFNRTYRHFCSHQHTPYRTEPSGFACGVSHGNILYFAHPVFSQYRGYGAVAYREFISKAIRAFLGDPRVSTGETGLSVSTNLPSTARLTLTRQESKKRSILHLLYAIPISRGGPIHLSGGTVAAAGMNIQVIEELLPLANAEVTLTHPQKVAKVTLEPQGESLAFEQAGGQIKLRVPSFACHQMVALQDA